MRLHEVLTEQQLDERPMGVLGKLASKAKTFVPGRTGRRAKGELKIGDMANKLSDEFDEYLGQVDQGQGATPEIVIGFLKKKGYPTKSAEAAMKEPTMGQKIRTALGKTVSKVKDTAQDIGSGIKSGMDSAGQKQTTTNKTPPEGGTTQKIPSQTDDDNISIAGGKAKTPPIKKVVNQSVEHDNIIAEGFTGAQLDKIFMAAAKDYVQQNTGGIPQQGTGSVDTPAKGGGGGFISGFKKGFGMDGIPKNIKTQISQLDDNQKKKLLGMI